MAIESPLPPQSVTELNACVTTTSHRPAKDAKDTTFREWVVSNQIGISLTTLSMLLAVHHLYPSLAPYTTPFFQLSYYQPSQGVYIQGWDDIYFVISSVFAFTAIRAIAIEWVFRPMAQWSGLKKKTSIRLAEQGWMALYYAFFWSFGMYIWSQSNYWMDFKAIWAEWPARGVSGSMKWYLLAQLAFWVQQIFVINIEEPRKDHYQMLTHHFITSSLLTSAYVYGFYNVSNVVLSLMDVVDLLLPIAKILKYLGYELSCNVAFGVFMVVWLISRHIMYPLLCWSIFKDVPAVMPWGCYSGATGELISRDGCPDKVMHLFSPFLDIDGPICMNLTIKWIFLTSLLSLQALSIIWFSMVIRVAVGVLRTGNAEDTRSDDEEEEDEEIETLPKDAASSSAVAAEVSSTDWRRSNGSSTRPRRSDRKALLGRIGCETRT
ncbi:putative longevity-assurance protein (LAC1) [Aspergillus undulatus]|uniref:putative longevity-assurance protein (LAC1) n=1 Tax=Aspergillus undulatus TaxID=1810928 RepID=UPI003CCCA1FC